MTTTSRLQRKILRLQRQLGWPRWLHHMGPKTYEVRQHFIVLLLWSSTPIGFRRAVTLLRDLGFIVPSYSAVAKFFHRLPNALWQRVLTATIGQQPARIASIDGTGLSQRNPSYHYLRRIDGHRPSIPVKWSVLVCTRTKRVLAEFARVLPAHDVRDVQRLLDRTPVIVEKIVADKGYDAEHIHQLCANRRIIAIIPSRRNVRRGFYRKKMRKHYRKRTYHRREMSETVFSVLKGRSGGSVRCRSARTIRAELTLRAIAYNLKVRLRRLFQRGHVRQ